MERNLYMLFLVAFIFIIPITILAISNPVPERVKDEEQFISSEHIVIKFSHVVAESTPKGQAALRFAELVEARTGGRVEVQVYPNSQLYMDGEEVEALKKNNVQLIAPATAKMTEHFPFLLLFDLPYLFRDYESIHAFIDSRWGQEMMEHTRDDEMLGLAMWDNGFKHMIGRKPYRTPEDLKDSQVRVMPYSEVLKKQYDILDATPLPVRFAEVAELKEEEVIDASENTSSNIYSQKFHHYHNYLTLSNHGYLGYIVLTNETFWNDLPPEIQSILEETLQEVTEWQREMAQKFNQNDLHSLRQYPHLEILELNEEEKATWEETFRPLYEEFAPVIGEKYLEAALEINKEEKAEN